MLTLVGDIHAAEVTADNLAAGIDLAQHYGDVALRLFAAGAVDPDLRLAQRLLEWLRTPWGEDLISLPEIYQLGPNAIRDKRTAAHIVAVLEDHGWLVPIEGGAVVAGHRRRKALILLRARHAPASR